MCAPRRAIHTALPLLLIGCLPAAICAQRPTPSVVEGHRVTDVLDRSTLTEEDRLLALSRLWSEARFSFAYFDAIDLDWDSLYQAFIPRVRRASSDYEHYLELMRVFAHLRDGHPGVFWPREFNEALGYPPVEIRKVGGRPVIFRILTPTEELERLDIRPGLAVLRVDGRPAEELVWYWRALKTGSTEQATERLAHFRMLTGPRGSQVEVVLQKPDGTTRTVSLTRSERYFNDTNLAPPRLHASRELVGGVGYFRANQMAPPVAEAFGDYIEAAGDDLRGLVLDLRYNGGGSDRVSFDIVSRLIQDPLDASIHEVTAYRPDRRAFREEQERIRTPAGAVRPFHPVRG